MVVTPAYRRIPHKGGFATGSRPLYFYVKRASVQRMAGFVGAYAAAMTSLWRWKPTTRHEIVVAASFRT